MKTKITIIRVFSLLLYCSYLASQTTQLKSTSAETFDYISAFKDSLNSLAAHSNNALFKMHCNSILMVIKDKGMLTNQDSTFIANTYIAFNDSINGNAKQFNSYLERKRPLIMAWQSPTDGNISFFRIKLPQNWDPEKEYPMYIELHGLSSKAYNPIEYFSYPFRSSAATTFAFEDGYHVAPWARGNLWYQGISETDIWEGLDVLNEIIKIDPSRKYLCGHSMGGYGTWLIAGHSIHTWAAIGIHAGALWYNGNNLVNEEYVNTIKHIPTYFVVGTDDGLLEINTQAYDLMEAADNENIEWVTFTGGHEYLSENVENMYLWMRDFVNNDWMINGLQDNSTNKEIDLTAFPNPFSLNTSIHLNLAVSGIVKLEVVNQNGQIIQQLMNGYQFSGNLNMDWTPGNNILSGIYFLRLTLNGSSIVKPISFIKER